MAAQPVLPTSLPGFSIDLQREPSADGVNIATASSGAELRSTWQSIPRYKYQVSFELLRNTALLEAQTMWDLFTRMFGQLNSFLITDPEDNTVTAHGFGQGTGSVTAFQLQRRMLGNVYDNLGGPWATSSTSRTNSLARSQALATSPWSLTSMTAVNNTAVAPDGTITGTVLTVAGAGNVQQAAGAAAATGQVTFSVWLQSAAGATVTLTIFDSTAGSNVATQNTVVPAGAGWQRVQLTGSVTSGHNLTPIISLGGAGTINAWGAQLEQGAAPTQYIATTAAGATLAPSFWPQMSDGFEPIYDLDTSRSAFGIYVNGALKAPGTDYALSSTGLVTFAVAPTLNSKLTWSGSFFRRVRFADSSIKYDRIVTSWYGAKQINLQSVVEKPS